MAEVVTVEGQEFKKRHPLGVLGLAIIALGIYALVWYYKINDEARRYLKDDSIKPGIALLAILLGWIIIVPPFISIYRTGERVQRMEQKAGVQQQISPALTLALFIIISLVAYPYVQEHLNRLWDAATMPAATAPPPPPPPAPGPPEPPAPQPPPVDEPPPAHPQGV